jgi:AraC-like DNA-binding protein
MIRAMLTPEEVGLRLDAAFRGGAVVLVALTAWRLLFAHGGSIAARFGAAFCLVMAVYFAFSSRALHPLFRPGYGPFVLLINQGAVLFWWFALALFDDGFRWRWRLLAPAVGILGLSIAGLYLFPDFRAGIFLIYQAAVATILVLALALALRSLRNDLVDERRRFAIAISILIPVTGIATAIAETVEVWQPLHWGLAALQTAAMFVLSFLFCHWVIAHGAVIFAATPAPEEKPQDAPGDFSPADRIELARVRRLIADGALFDHGASVAQLARLAAIPEHRLRRLVNRGMGYRNFRELVNDARVEEARKRLADPDRVREQVLNLSWDLGYDSLAPFNRAFRERTGQSPTEFRKAALNGDPNASKS